MSSITVKCTRCQEPNTINNLSLEQIAELYAPGRRHIQDILPNHSAEQRELFISGFCGDCWAEIFDEENNDHQLEDDYRKER